MQSSKKNLSFSNTYFNLRFESMCIKTKYKNILVVFCLLLPFANHLKANKEFKKKQCSSSLSLRLFQIIMTNHKSKTNETNETVRTRKRKTTTNRFA